MRALVVDDCEAEQFLYRELIATNIPQAEVICAYNGEEALEKLKELGEALVLKLYLIAS